MTNREIKFRGKRKDSGEWVEGYYLPMASGAKHYIYLPLEYLNEHSRVEIDPATLGQYTGLKDRKGKGIYDGYILQDAKKQVGFVFFHKGAFYIEWQERDHYGQRTAEKFTDDYFESSEVIGNLHENPELLLTNNT